MITYIIIAVLMIIGIYALIDKRHNQTNEPKVAPVKETPVPVQEIHQEPEADESQTDEPDTLPTKTQLPIQGAYQKSWLFTYHEKDAYQKLKPIADELGYTIFAKVRLLDLLEPVKGIQKYKTYFYKVQAKHIDFVLCNRKLVAEWLIELDDSTHERPDRKERDRFVDEVVTSVGYKIIHVNVIDDNLKTILKR